ncbi:MAG: SIS domain-containing protein [Defluviitaleaceae bacterium]|nr:SIS domain-containing protein [Defluviitaleaceae bacterium]
MPVYESLFSRYPALATIRQPLADAFKVLYGCYSSGGKLLICGNGGSAADSTHIVGELMKGFLKKRNLSDKVKNDIDIAFDGRIENASHYFQRSLPAIDLTGAVSLSTAFLNDVHPEMVFAQQTFGYGKPGDVLLCISTSGNAKNAVNAALTAKALKLKTIALTGGNGGELGKICGVSIRVPGKNTPEIQEYHLPVYHTLCAMLEEAFF